MAKQGAVVELVYRAGQDARPLIEAARASRRAALRHDGGRGGQAFGPVPAEAFRAFTGQLPWDEPRIGKDDGSDSSDAGLGLEQ